MKKRILALTLALAVLAPITSQAVENPSPGIIHEIDPGENQDENSTKVEEKELLNPEEVIPGQITDEVDELTKEDETIEANEEDKTIEIDEDEADEIETENDIDLDQNSSEDVFKQDFLKHNDSIIRIAGKDRFETSALISSNLLLNQSKLILASGENFPDALAGSSLVEGKYPILLTRSDTLPNAILNEVNRLGADEVIILGGTNTVSSEIENLLASSKIVRRIAGQDRFDTALEIAKASPKQKALLADGSNFPDALASTGLAYINGQNIILSPKDQVDGELEAYLREYISEAIIVGGENSLSNNLVDQLLKIGVGYEGRIAGSNRFTSSLRLAENMAQLEGVPREVIIANGTSFPDALSASILSQKFKAPILLVEKDNIKDQIVDFLVRNQNSIDQAIIVGGENMVSKDLSDYIQKAIMDVSGHPGPYEKPILNEFPYVKFERGLDHANVKVYKEKLKELGYYRGEVNTNFDAEAEIALRLYQYVNNLQINPKLSQDTWSHILENKGAFFDRSQIGKIEFTVPYTSQAENGAWVACVPTSLYMAIQHKGHALDVSYRDYLDNYVPRAKAGNPAEGFPGTPYQRSDAYQPSIWPNVQVKVANSLGAKASDLTGAPFYALQDELYMGNAVSVIGTFKWRPVGYRTYMVDGKPTQLIENLHGYVLAGYNPANKTYLITEPYNDEREDFTRSKGGVRGKRLDFWENESNLIFNYNYMKQATSVWN